MNKKKLTFFIICNSIVCLIIGAFIPLTIHNFYRNESNDPNMLKFMEVYDTIKDEWYFLDDGDEEEYINRALDAMVNDQNDDRYLQYYPKENVDTNRFGIGITASKYDGYLIIKDVYENSPAKKANLTKDMIITKVNNIDIRNKSLNEVSKLISGPLNSDVILTCKYKDGNSSDIKVKRSEFQKQTVFGLLNSDDIGTIRITNFDTGTVTQFEDYLKTFKNNNVNKLIIDLRDNGGGYIYSFKKMADLFIPKGKVLGEYIHKDESKNEISYTESGVDYIFDKIYILVNQNSASASESFTCAMKDNLNNVTVLGLNTYGKGIAQKIVTFTDGSSLKYTYAEYKRPNKKINGGTVHKIGISPDLKIPDIGNYNLIDKQFNNVTDAKRAYSAYFDSLKGLSEEEQVIVNNGKKEISLYDDKIVFSNDVKNLLSKLTYDEREKSYEDQLNKVVKIAKGE